MTNTTQTIAPTAQTFKLTLTPQKYNAINTILVNPTITKYDKHATNGIANSANKTINPFIIFNLFCYFFKFDAVSP